ncbi:MAG: 23S rRNA (guanosine(2251)-2'-O)-methyltransferase RlmB [Actinomycetales bacterium]|jgi:23S rRNA (guanosine2251-2'-O)-methyltransferase|nr:23S rRNA (guanosine(2251)-2'-O)-methyltransferase RlmB [Actinomycetales bacterium]
MAGNSRRRGATRKPGTKKGATTGSGGKGRRALEGRGPTPKAEDRPYHPAAKRKAAAERTAATQKAAGRTGRAAPPPRRAPARRPAGAPEIVAGRNAVVEALRAGVPVETVWVGHRVEADDRVREVRRVAGERGLPLLETTAAELDRLTGGVVHQGVAVAVRPYRYASLADVLARAERAGEPPLVVALDGVTDPRNLGAVLRSAGAFGAHGVVVPERRAAGVTAAAWKVSAGAAARVPVARVTNLVRALGELREAGCFVVGLDAGGTTPVGSLHLATDPVVLVVGSEGKGLGRLVRSTCDVVAAIPIRATTESLNAGVAAGIALYEVARLRGA